VRSPGSPGPAPTRYTVIPSRPPAALEHVAAHVREAFLRIVDPDADLEGDAQFGELGDPRRGGGGGEHALRFARRLEHQLLGKVEVRAVCHGERHAHAHLAA
jgi:hypothetical protein